MRIVLHRDGFSNQRDGEAGFASLSGQGSEPAVTLQAFSSETTSVVEIPIEEDTAFDAEVLIGADTIGFTVEGMRNSNELHIHFVSPTEIHAQVQFDRDTPARPRARCADGTEGYPCVTCKGPSGAIRVCC